MYNFKGVSSGKGKSDPMICPLSLLLGRFVSEVSIDEIVDWETAAESYNAIPFEGNWLAQPRWLTRAFDHIRSGKNSATNAIQDDALKSTKSGAK